MSFQDIDSQAATHSSSGRVAGRPEVAAGVFQIGTAVTGFRRLVDAIGSPKDSLEHRQTLQEARRRIAVLVKDTSAKIKALYDVNRNAPRVEEAKLARDLQAVLLDFQKAQKLAVEREATYPMSGISNSDEHSAEYVDLESQQLLLEQKRQQLISLDNEISFNEAMIEEREQGIKDIQSDVGQVNEIFKDLAVLLENQRPTIDEVDIQIEAASTLTSQARTQLLKGSKNSRKSSSYCWVLIIFVVVLSALLIILILY